ncbi:calcium-activated potassium channel subunit alpha-1-like [Actinia tenebrosa]|uniref:Calcium-activated potassium channel subunit alpha-1-like n=1 Tax=Actinia tenebrosa TaxID=6105 RepID=A0A6P8IZD3_ACTTE|nr:calcium-activated potassium channel subunit alpha-1-like [Actinia tenebrosa]
MTVKDCNVSSTMSCDKTCLPPKEDRKWWYFVITSFSLFLGGLIVIYLTRVIIRLCNSKKRKLNPSDKLAGKKRNEEAENKYTHEEEDSLYIRMREKAGSLLTAQTLKGQCFVVISFLFSISYVVLYAVEASYPVEHCLDLNDQILWLFEIGLNTFFILHFLLRFLAANDKLLFWCDPLSLVDFFTIPQVFVSIIIRQNWIGKSILRSFLTFCSGYMTHSLMAQQIHIRSFSHGSYLLFGAVTLTKAVGNLSAVLFCFGGLIENTGDPWNVALRQDWNYFDCLYFLVVCVRTH